MQYMYCTCVQCACIQTYLSICLILSQISFFSSIGNMFGTSPVLSRLLMSSRKLSSFICMSVKRNTAWLLPSALFLRIFFRSSLHSTEV